ncbi:hypothetical protein R1sor_020492 [Riccia sorocarpa]|uniref:Uncharacterized protein n=1 Tax=Riccia sorocarpa TaxID=122646 RepID=A0ABD3IJD0_9MARC
MSELNNKQRDDCTLSQSLIDQLKKLSVATQEASPLSVVIRKKASSLTLVDQLKQPKVVTFEVEEDLPKTKSCTLQLSVHFIDLEKLPSNPPEGAPSAPGGNPEAPPSVGGLHRATSSSKESSTSSPAQQSNRANRGPPEILFKGKRFCR